VKPARLLALAVIPLLFACLPTKPEVHLTEIPAGPAAESLALRRQSFSTFKAFASVESVRAGRKRSFDTVGIIVDGQKRLRAEAFGPLGQSLFSLVWSGGGLLVRRDEGNVVAMPARAGLERIFGMEIDAAELCAVLTANLPAGLQPADGRAYQEPDGSVLLEWNDGGIRRRYFVVPPEPGSGRGFRITASEVYRSRELVYRARYEQTEEVSGYLMPKTVKLENPERNISLTILYSDLDVNLPLSDEVFQLPEGGPTAPWTN
jgi:hypothetical protein